MCDDVDSILYVQHKKLIVRRLYFRFENCEEKIENNLDVTKICRYFAAALMKDTLLKSKVLKKSFSKKIFQKDLEVVEKRLTFAPVSMKITLHECESS